MTRDVNQANWVSETRDLSKYTGDQSFRLECNGVSLCGGRCVDRHGWTVTQNVESIEEVSINESRVGFVDARRVDRDEWAMIRNVGSEEGARMLRATCRQTRAIIDS